MAIKEEVLAGEMPPWGAAPGIGHFANDRRLTRHELELIASWVDGGAPFSPMAAVPPVVQIALATPAPQPPAGGALTADTLSESVVIPLAPAEIIGAMARTASVTLQLPAGMLLTAWTFEPGIPAIVERVDLELGSRWLGTWTPSEPSIEFPDDAGAPLTTSAQFTARVAYRAPAARSIDHSRLRVWMVKEPRKRSVRDVTVLRSWRALAPVEIVALRPAREGDEVQVIARFTGGRTESLAVLAPPSHGPHPTYRLARPLALTAGGQVETTGAVRLLYSDGATRTSKPNVRRRPRR